MWKLVARLGMKHDSGGKLKEFQTFHGTTGIQTYGQHVVLVSLFLRKNVCRSLPTRIPLGRPGILIGIQNSKFVQFVGLFRTVCRLEPPIYF